MVFHGANDSRGEVCMIGNTEIEDTTTFVPLYEAYAKYEQRKAALPTTLTPDEYREACKQIADELGI